MNTLLAILKVTDARRDVILAGGLPAPLGDWQIDGKLELLNNSVKAIF